MRWRRTAKVTSSPGLEEGWVGKLDYDVLTASGQSLGVLEILLRHDDVEICFCEITLGTFRRDVVRQWMTSPGEPLTGDCCAFSLQRRGVALALGCARPSLIPSRVSRQLREAVCGA